MRLLSLMVCASLMLAGNPCAAAPLAGERLNIGVTGSTTGQGVRNPTYLLAQAPIQDLVLEAANGPITRTRAQELLAGSDAGIEDLVATGLLAPLPDGRVRLAMNLLTTSDQRLIRSLAERQGRSLAGAFLADRATFQRLMAGYDLRSVDPSLVAMALVGCVVLDWDGLTVTAAKAYRITAVDYGANGKYVAWGREKASDVSVRALYWGSHNKQVGDIWLTSFGDHHSLPRPVLPDLIWNIGPDRIDGDWPRALRATVAIGAKEGLTTTEADAARIMRALRGGGLAAEALASASQMEPQRVTAALRLLRNLNYVRQADGKYESIVPIFTVERDAKMIADVRAEGQKILLAWLRSNYGPMKAELSGLNALKAGVSYDQLFTEIWHDLFGWANYHLVRDGMLADPYGPKVPYTGFIPFVWEAPLKLND